jgi:Leucine rich repeat
VCRHAEWPDFVMDMPFDPVCAVPVVKPTPTHVSGGGAAGPAPSESAKSIPPIAAAPPPNHDDQDLEEDDFEEEELDEESEYETDEDTEPPAAVTTALVTAMKPLITPEANAYPSEDEGTEASEGEIQGSQPQQVSQKPPVVILPSLLAPALTPAPAPVASTISDDSEYTSDDEPPTVTVSTSAVKTQETSDSEPEVSFGDEVEDVLPQSATVNQSSFAHPSPQLSVTAPTTLPVMPPSPPVSVSRSMTSLSQFERKDDGFDTLPVDDTVVQASNVYDDSLAEAVSLRRGSEASSRASIRFGKPESPISRQPSRQRAASTPQSAIVESKPLPSITLDLSDKTIEAIEIAVLAHDPLTGNVTQLILSGCKSLSLSSLHQLSASLSHVTDLVLSRCNLGTISSQLRDPKWLDFVPALTTLDLSDNDLTSIPNLESHRKLVAINLSKNRLKVIGGLEALTQLSELDVSYNEVKSLLSLRTLSLNSHLRSLIVTPNPLTQLDRCVWMRVV